MHLICFVWVKITSFYVRQTPRTLRTPLSHNMTPPITITLGMWNHLLSRLSNLEATMDGRYTDHQRVLETLDGNHNTLKNCATHMGRPDELQR